MSLGTLQLGANYELVVIKLRDEDGGGFRLRSLPPDKFKCFLDRILVLLDQVSCCEAWGDIVSRHAVDQYIGGIPANNRLDKFYSRVEVLADILCGDVFDRHDLVLVRLGEHGRQLLVQSNDVRNVVALQDLWVLRRANISQVQIVDDFVHFVKFRIKL